MNPGEPYFEADEPISIDITRDAKPTTLTVGIITIDRSTRSARCNGNYVRLTTAEFDLLWLLASNAGRVLTRDDIYIAMRGFEHNGLERSMDLRIARLRKKLGDNGRNPKCIKSVRSVGYLMAAEEQQASH